MRRLWIFLMVCSFSMLVGLPKSIAQESGSRENLKLFLTTSAYGLGAGALLGVASLAFSDDPAGKLNQVARGASLGLYAGIGLGLYYIYGNGSNKTSESYSSWKYFVLPEFKEKAGLSQQPGLKLFVAKSFR